MDNPHSLAAIYEKATGRKIPHAHEQDIALFANSLRKRIEADIRKSIAKQSKETP